ncbi:MAG: hypothetical protein ACLS5G_02245 [Streptococcus sp.]
MAELGATRIQLDEPALVKDLTSEEKALFLNSTTSSWLIKRP